MNQKSIHDNKLISYSVNEKSKEIKFRTVAENGQAVDIIFKGVGAYFFEHHSLSIGTIFFGTDEVDPNSIVKKYWPLFESGKVYGWPGAWGETEEIAKTFFESNQIKGFEITSSCGLSGWVLSKNILIESEEADQKAILSSIEDFGTAYYFLMRIRILNAEAMVRAIEQGEVKNGLLLEFMLGYIQVAASEFSLNLYDVIQQIKTLDPSFKYKANGDIDQILKFRRSVVAHRGKNWESEESVAIHKALDENTSSIFSHSKGAMNEFCELLTARKISYGPTPNRPRAQLIRGPEFQALLKGVPTTGLFTPVPSVEELRAFFGKDE